MNKELAINKLELLLNDLKINQEEEKQAFLAATKLAGIEINKWNYNKREK